jgi:hypothetical protein
MEENTKVKMNTLERSAKIASLNEEKKAEKKAITKANIEKAKMKDFPIDEEEKKIYRDHNLKILESYREKHNVNTANWFAFDFMSKYPGEYVLLKDVQEYCSNSYKEINGEILGDPPRSFEICRKNTLPLAWEEAKVSKYKLVRFNPSRVEKITDNIVNESKHKSDGFSKEMIEKKLKENSYKCELTGLPNTDGGLAADHFIPKEKGGQSVETNLIIINKILNEKKNNTPPVEWFCKSILTNFLNICKKTGLLNIDTKKTLIDFIENFN